MPKGPSQQALEPHAQEFVDSLAAALPIYTLSPADARSVLARAQSVAVGKPSTQIEDVTFPVGPRDPSQSGSSARPALPESCRW